MNTLLQAGTYVKALNKTETTVKTIRCTTDGNTFKNVAEAAEFYGISRTTVYASVNGVKHPRHRAFERIRE